MGSYHQLYRLDGRLIAMGVLDLLPKAVSGVYLLYHTDFEKWQLGKVCIETRLSDVIFGEREMRMKRIRDEGC